MDANIKANHNFSEKLEISHGPHIGWANDDHMQSYFGINAAQAAGTVRSAPIMPKAVFRM